jgi:hypothetical protein
MRKLSLCLVLSLATILTGCANQQGGRSEKAAPSTPSPLASFEQERKTEINQAEQTRLDFVAAFHERKIAAQIQADPLRLNEITVTDKQSHQTRRVQVFESLSFTLPLALKKNPDYDQAIAKIKALAEKIADARGVAEIQFFLLPADAAANKVKFDSGTAKSPRGNPITVSKSPDKSLAKGMQRLVIKAAPMHNVSL